MDSKPSLSPRKGLFMKNLYRALAVLVVCLSISLANGCSSNPGEAEDVPMTKEAVQENEAAGKVPGT
jgi:hypothetical protein